MSHGKLETCENCGGHDFYETFVIDKVARCKLKQNVFCVTCDFVLELDYSLKPRDRRKNDRRKQSNKRKGGKVTGVGYKHHRDHRV